MSLIFCEKCVVVGLKYTTTQKPIYPFEKKNIPYFL